MSSGQLGEMEGNHVQSWQHIMNGEYINPDVVMAVQLVGIVTI